MATLLERFEAKVEPDTLNGCWLWRGVIWDRRIGYGKISVSGKVHKAHRVAWELYRGPIPEKAHVLHTCDNALCVNPEHLYLGDQRRNNLDRDERGRHVPLHGEQNGHSKLTACTVHEIRKSRESSLALAPRFEVDASTIRKIRRRELWAHI